MRQKDGADLLRMILEERPHLFANSVVFVDENCFRRQAEIIAAIETVVSSPAYVTRVLAHAPASARFAPKSEGVFLSYDFHLGANGAQLIEINTNAGGGLLNALLARAQNACCDGIEAEMPESCLATAMPLPGRCDPETAFLEMFADEWRLERGDTPLRSIAIVDDTPENQFLLPEFLLFHRLFERRGIETVICDPRELTLSDGALWRDKLRIDLVYNRLTDFPLEWPEHRALREAYLGNAAVVTPHPRSHAVYADKRNLALLTDAQALREMGVDPSTSAILLNGIAPTAVVDPDRADELWAHRKRLFFKPAAGYGSKAAYRGDKLTRRVFEDILHGEYVAQHLVPPSERLLNVDGNTVMLKLDLRNFVYHAEIQMMTARLYQGQTTNFRTPGGGFATVLIVPSGATPLP